MILSALETLAQVIESAGLSFHGVALNGSSVAKRCTIGVVDPDVVREEGIAVGIDYRFAVTQPFDRPSDAKAKTVLTTNVLTQAVAVIPPPEKAQRMLGIHLYIHETREPKDRKNDDVNRAYLRNESKLFAALDKAKKTYTVGNYIFETQYDTTAFVDGDFLGVHAVFMWRLTYPLTEDSTGATYPPSNAVVAYRARRIRLVNTDVPNVQTIVSTLPLVVPRGSEIKILGGV